MRSERKSRRLPPPRGDEGELLRRHSARLEHAVVRLAPWAPPWLVEEACGHAWSSSSTTSPSARGCRLAASRRLPQALRLNRKKVNERSLEVELTLRGGEKVVVLDRLSTLADPHDTETVIEAREALHAVAGLRWRRRRVLALRLAGYSYKEIARMLGVTYTKVWVIPAFLDLRLFDGCATRSAGARFGRIRRATRLLRETEVTHDAVRSPGLPPLGMSGWPTRPALSAGVHPRAPPHLLG